MVMLSPHFIAPLRIRRERRDTQSSYLLVVLHYQRPSPPRRVVATIIKAGQILSFYINLDL